MASRRFFDGAQIDLGLIPIEAPTPPPGNDRLKVWNGSAWI